jgi:hypothetical protein
LPLRDYLLRHSLSHSTDIPEPDAQRRNVLFVLHYMLDGAVPLRLKNMDRPVTQSMQPRILYQNRGTVKTHRLIVQQSRGECSQIILFQVRTGVSDQSETRRMRFGKSVTGERADLCDVAYAAPHFCLTSSRARSGHHDGEGTLGTLDSDRYDALHAFESRFEGGCRGKTGRHCYKSATPCTKMQQFESPL